MVLKESKVKQRIRKDEIVIGSWIQNYSPWACEAAGASGMDYVVLDFEHGNFSDDAALHMVRACDALEIDAFVRVPNTHVAKVKNALDWGATGIVLPQVKNGKEAREFVEQARFVGEPGGQRNSCPWIRCSNYSAVPYEEYAKWCNENRQIWGIIENYDAVQNIEEIAKAGFDTWILGPFDLSFSMGLKGDLTHPEVVKCMDHVIDVALKKGIPLCATLFNSDVEELKKEAAGWMAKGVKNFTSPSEGAMLYGAYANYTNSCRIK